MVDISEGALKVFAASDFFSIEVRGRGLVTHYVLFVISLGDRVVHIAGITTQPDEAWMLQVARNLVDEEGGALSVKRYLAGRIVTSGAIDASWKDAALMRSANAP